jgi:hypothetical protein
LKSGIPAHDVLGGVLVSTKQPHQLSKYDEAVFRKNASFEHEENVKKELASKHVQDHDSRPCDFEAVLALKLSTLILQPVDFSKFEIADEGKDEGELGKGLYLVPVELLTTFRPTRFSLVAEPAPWADGILLLPPMTIIRAYQLVSTSNVDAILNGRAYQSSTSQASSFAQHIVHYNKINQSRNDSMMDMSSIIPDDLEFEDRSVSTKFKSLVKGSSFKSLLKSQKQVEEGGDGAAAAASATATSDGIELSNMPSSPGASKLKSLVKGSSFKSLIKSHTQQQASNEKITLNATLGEDQDTTTAATGRSRASLDLEDAHGEEWMATQQPELRFRVASQTLTEAGGGRGIFSNIRYRHSSFESSEVVKLTERSRAKSFGPGKLRKTTLFGGGTVAEKPIELENLPTLTEYVNR